MANYKGRLDLTRPYKAVEAVLYNSSDTHVETAVTDNYGFYYFDNIPTGSYTVKFFGRNYRTPNDDHLITVVDVFDSESLAPLTFHDTPALGVGEGDPIASVVGERSEAIITLSYLQEKTGILGFVDIFYTLAGVSSE